MTKIELRIKLVEARVEPDLDAKFRVVVRALLNYIDDPEITAATIDSCYGGW